MALQKQPIQISFGQGVDTKTDKFQVQMGKFLSLVNTKFDKGGQLTKRDGFPLITTAPTDNLTTLLTLGDSLLATGNSLYAYNNQTMSWTNKGTVQPISLSTSAAVRTSSSQVTSDSVTASNGLSMVVYQDGTGSYYKIVDTDSGQSRVNSVSLGSTATQPRAILLGSYFVVVYLVSVSGTPTMRYVAVPVNNPDAPLAVASITTAIASTSVAFDVCVANNFAYIMWNASDGGGAVRYVRLSNTLVLTTEVAVAGAVANLCCIVPDTTLPTANIWIVWYTAAGTTVSARLVNFQLTIVLATTSVVTATTIAGLTGTSQQNVLSLIYQVQNDYSYAAIRSDYLQKKTVTSAGVVSSASTILRGVGLSSKAFLANNSTTYLMVNYRGAYQPSYFLIDVNGTVLARLAYQNGTGALSGNTVPSVTVLDDVAHVSYLRRTQLLPINRTQGSTAPSVYSQAGVDLAVIDINTTQQYSAEAANCLHLTGGQIWQYDGVTPVEHSFHVFPEDVAVSTSTSGGSITDQQYFYIFIYEWTDGSGLIHRSAPSIPVGIVTAGGNTSTNTVNVPTLRLTSKPSINSVRIVGYRWSAANQVYYQFTSITSPTLNNTSVDSVTFTDTLADASIIGNPVLYTTGAVVENIAAPAANDITMFKSRAVIIDAEDPNTLWYSKQLLEGTPIEFSDLFTIYVSPAVGNSAISGPCTAVSNMDDKLIIFKKNSIYYVTGNGPDITGANNDFSEPTYITSAAGCENPRSIVLTPNGLMFQSDKGIWLLKRDLGTQYIGDAVEQYNNEAIVSALTIPGTNQVRFVLDNGITLMYDYYYGQWTTWTGAAAISSTLFENKQTLLNSFGQILQESPGTYIDGPGNPVLVSFTTAWIKLIGLQSYQRAYYCYLLGGLKLLSYV
jgi:hypothetical protein